MREECYEMACLEQEFFPAGVNYFRIDFKNLMFGLNFLVIIASGVRCRYFCSLPSYGLYFHHLTSNLPCYGDVQRMSPTLGDIPSTAGLASTAKSAF